MKKRLHSINWAHLEREIQSKYILFDDFLFGLIIQLISLNIFRTDLDQATASCSKKIDDSPFNKIGYNSFGKASVSSTFSAKSNGSTGNENLDSLLKTISKEPSNGTMNLQESLNDANSIRLNVNKTSELENNTGTLNNKTKLANIGGTPLPPSQIKCNILKGKIFKII